MDDDQFTSEESEQRLHKILDGAFGGSPTPLKDIPKKSGMERAPKTKKDQPPRRRRQRKNRAA